jgi:hypothetical protein
MPRTYVCQFEGCDVPHCRRCGHHYSEWYGETGNICDACLIERGAAETEAIVAAFGGNSEEAAKAMGW